MKKKWIVEAAYIVAGLTFLGVCMTGGKGGTPGGASSDGVTPGGLTGTIVPGTPEGSVTPGGSITPGGQAGGVTPSGEGTEEPSPVPTKTPGPTQGAQPTPEEPGGTVTPPGTDVTEPPAPTESITPTEPAGSTGTVRKEIKNEDYTQYDNETCAWWFLRKRDHSPSGSGEAFPVAPYSAYYRNTEVTDEDKVVYLTFDCGYENGYTPAILDTLAEENVKVMFFVTKDFVVKNPDYIKRMKEEGHLVGNHTVRHLSSPSLTPEELFAELNEVADTMEELTGYRPDPFFRPPMGEYSERTLKVTQDMGYSTMFWSIAYHDYDVNDQPGKEYVVEHFKEYHHNGTVALLHNTSESNMQALGEVIDLLKAEGYRFGLLTEFAGERPADAQGFAAESAASQ